MYDPDSGAVEDAWSYSYDNHAATAITTTRAGARFAMEYDAAGNMIRQADGAKDMAKQMAYDSYNRIRSVTDEHNGNLKGQYWYDDQGFRVRRLARQEIDGREQEVELLYPSMYFAVESHRNGHGRARPETACAVNNIYLNGVRIAAALPDGQARYYLTDQVDSVKVVTNDSGMVVTSHEYMPFGEDWITEGDTKNAPKYNSQELDKESGYYFYNARHYDPEIGRFVTPDSVIDGELSTQGWNRFAYVHNNPIRYKDPTGHGVLDTLKSVGSGVVDRASEYGSAISGAASALKQEAKEAIKDPKAYAYKVDDKLGEKVNKALSNPRQFLKDAGSVCGNTLLDTYKEISGLGRISRIIEADNPAKQLGKELTDVGLAYAGAKGADLLGKGFKALKNISKGAQAAEDGSFTIKDWGGYPDGIPKPKGPFKLIEGEGYNTARKAANQANAAMHRADSTLAGKQIHEIHPVKFGGNPVDPGNKIPLSPQDHAPVTKFWNGLQRKIEGN